MCGRYVIAYDPSTLVSGFSLNRAPAVFERRYNVAPTSDVPVVYETREGERIAETMRWGLVPHWAKDSSGGARLNNARVEGVADKPSFRQAVRRRRCLLPATGFYEWQPRTDADGKPFKQPWFFSATDGPLLAMAGLFEAWRPPGAADDTPWLLTCCVLTTAADAVMAPVHERMPVLLPPDAWAAWLARGQTDPDALAPLLQGLPTGALQAWPVDRVVGRASAEGAGLMAPVAPPADAAATPAPPAEALHPSATPGLFD